MKALLHLPVYLTEAIGFSAFAQNVAPREAALERTALYEQVRTLNSRLVNILETQELLIKKQSDLDDRLDRLARELGSVKDRIGKEAPDYVTREELKVYVDKLKEIDEKRQSDKALIVKSIQELSKLPVVAAPVAPPATLPPVGPTYEYTVQPGDNLGGIVRAYNTEFEKQGLKNVKISQIEQANPGLNPDRILVGQVIRIPIPDKN